MQIGGGACTIEFPFFPVLGAFGTFKIFGIDFILLNSRLSLSLIMRSRDDMKKKTLKFEFFEKHHFSEKKLTYHRKSTEYFNFKFHLRAPLGQINLWLTLIGSFSLYFWRWWTWWKKKPVNCFMQNILRENIP